ncbi:hypothetical protein COO91_02015 [Nostoc flagelliforme CCNUN1]|uniref:TET-Associated Glycosyltransferase domain-containing protein n=1 Tax=Nostoc flagelliforme CCNUN1 TaxID=2038116 RepID=A0A2K8SKW7_9NOSO|nr:hypothetical protein [Nostoc flagelliforme]AUB36114.1 hypothetical protein COO91_02015 [Nostoc flagelliforme CCNUN1]
MSLKILIPSRGRANCVKTTSVVNGAILCVAESQAEAYREFNPGVEVVAHPEDLEIPGPVARKWAWMYEHFGHHVFILDDDIVSCVRLHAAKGDSYKVSPEVATELIYNADDIAAQMGCYLFGFNTQPDPRNYHGLKPFRMTGMCWASGMGLRPGSKIWWHEGFDIYDDFWIVLLNKYHHRFAFFDDRFCFRDAGDTFTGTGGAAEFRTKETGKKDFELLKKYFGDAIKPKQDSPRSKRKSEWQPTLNVDF